MELNDQAVILFNDQGYTLGMIAGVFSTNRMAVKRYLNARGVDTRRRIERCRACDEPLRGRLFHRGRHVYCGPDCYYTLKYGADYQFYKAAERKVFQYYSKEDRYYLNFIDRNIKNIDLSNLELYESGDAFAAKDKPLWRGADVVRQAIARNVK